MCQSNTVYVAMLRAENACSIIIVYVDGVCWQSPSGGKCRALVSSAGPPGGAVEVDLHEG